MKKSILLLSCFVFGLIPQTFAQGFYSFKVENELVKTLIKNIKDPNPSFVEAIVLKNNTSSDLNVKYRLLTNCQFESGSSMSDNFTNPQEVTIEKNGEGTKKWNVIVHELEKASLPLDIKFDSSNKFDLNFKNPKNWAAQNLPYTYQTGLKFCGEKAAFYIAFNPGASKLEFEASLLCKEPFDGEFVIECSVNGITWEKVMFISGKDAFVQKQQKVDLPSEISLVRMVYQKRHAQNIVINNILVN